MNRKNKLELAKIFISTGSKWIFRKAPASSSRSSEILEIPANVFKKEKKRFFCFLFSFCIKYVSWGLCFDIRVFYSLLLFDVYLNSSVVPESFHWFYQVMDYLICGVAGNSFRFRQPQSTHASSSVEFILQIGQRLDASWQNKYVHIVPCKKLWHCHFPHKFRRNVHMTDFLIRYVNHNQTERK